MNNSITKLEGIPYVQGQSTYFGCDCIGLVFLYHCFSTVNQERIRRQARDQKWGVLDSVCEDRQGSACAGDIITYLRSSGEVNHVGVYLGDGLVLQTENIRRNCSFVSRRSDWIRFEGRVLSLRQSFSQ